MRAPVGHSLINKNNRTGTLSRTADQKRQILDCGPIARQVAIVPAARGVPVRLVSPKGYRSYSLKCELTTNK